MPIRPLALALALLAVPASAASHTLPIRHRALATARLVEGSGRLQVDVMLWMQLPPGAHARRLLARYDVNRSGRFDPAEATLLADDRGAEVVGGFFLEADGRAAKPGGAKSSARLEDDGGLSIAVLLTYDLPPPGPGGARLALRLRPSTPRPGPVHPRACAAELSALPPLVLAEASAPLDVDRRVAGPAPLRPGGPGLAVRVAPAPPPAAEP